MILTFRDCMPGSMRKFTDVTVQLTHMEFFFIKSSSNYKTFTKNNVEEESFKTSRIY